MNSTYVHKMMNVYHYSLNPHLKFISLQSMVQSYLEGVGWGLEQLQEARAELREVSHALRKAGRESNQNAEGVKALERLREVSVNHCQLLAAVSNLPRLYSGERRCSVNTLIHNESVIRCPIVTWS